MLGAFSEAIQWKERQIAEQRKETVTFATTRQHELYQELTRLHLKKGDFVRAGEAFQQYYTLYEQDYSSREKDVDLENYLLAIDFYQWGGDRGSISKVVEKLMDRCYSVDGYFNRDRLIKIKLSLESRKLFKEAARVLERLL